MGSTDDLLRRLWAEYPEEAEILKRALADRASRHIDHAPSLETLQSRTLTESLNDLVGRDVNPAIELTPAEVEPALGDGDSELLKAMRERGPTVGRYEIRREVARGGMGVVMRAYDRELHRNIAMKVLLGNDGSLMRAHQKKEHQRLARFLEEAQVTAQLDHPGIVPIHELGIDADGRVFFTMKLVKGETLSQIFDKVKMGVDDWTVTRVLWSLLRVCEAMDFAHRRKVVHRDLKPSNIMIGEFGETYVMDWGLARVLDRPDSSDRPSRGPRSDSSVLPRKVFSERINVAQETPDSPLLTNDGDRLGTPAYMSPEQAEGRIGILGPATDVYSVGAILYHLLTGSAPYMHRERRDALSIVNLVIAGPPQPIHTITREVNGELQSICEKAMARKIGERYATMADLASDLRAYLENRVVRAHRSGAFIELRKWTRRNRAAAWATVAALIVGLIGVGVIMKLAIDNEVEGKQNAVEKATIMARWRDESEKLKTTKEEVAAKQTELEAKQGELKQAAEELARTASELTSQQEAVVKSREDLERLNATLGDTQQQKQTSEAELESARSALSKANADLKAKQGELAIQQGNVKAQRDEVNKLKQERDDLQKLAEFLSAAVRPSIELVEISKLEAATSDLWPARARKVDAMREWVTRAEDQLASAQSDRDRFKDLRRKRNTTENAPSNEEPEAAFIYQTLDALESAAEKLESITLPDVTSRLARAETIERLTLVDHRKEWDETIEAIANTEQNPQYAGFELKPIAGLVPLGRDSRSGLFEFWHVESGDLPSRDSSGRIRPSERSGIVLVLVPGGKFMMGSREVDFLAFPEARGREDEQPPHEVELPAFFISKYEITQEQWRRCGSTTDSCRFRARTRAGGREITGMNPVESVPFDEAARILRHVTLELPTEAQWEYAARGGTETPWWSGLTSRDAEQAGNIADLYAKEHGGSSWECDSRLDDGQFAHAPVGAFRPNGYGLYDVIGNVAEWCLDDFRPYRESTGLGLNGLHLGSSDAPFLGRVVRGGSFRDSISRARSSARSREAPEARSDSVGVRAVMNFSEAR